MTYVTTAGNALTETARFPRRRATTGAPCARRLGAGTLHTADKPRKHSRI